MTVGVYTISDDAIDKAQGEYLASQLSKIGWKTKLHELAGANYFVIIGNQATKAQIGWTDWFEDYPYPDRLVRRSPERHRTSTSSTTTTTRTSTSRTTNAEIDRLGHLPPDQAFSSSTTNAWAALDKKLMVKYATRGSVPERRHHVVLLVEDGSELRRLHRPVRRSGADVPEVAQVTR